VVLFAYSPVAAPVLRGFPRTAIHYDCADDHVRWWGNTRHMERLNTRLERDLVRRARTVTVTSEALLAKMRRDHDRVFLVPNGVDWEHFATPPGAAPAELSGLPRPILGFVGVKAEYVDWDLVERVAHAQVGSLVFVGPGRRFGARFAGHPNVHVLGPRPYAELPRYVQAFDVGLIPANRAPAAVAASPSKLFQYLAAGKPVVATDLPELVPHRDVIHVADNADVFVDRIKEALEEPTRETARRQELARMASWQRRARQILDVIAAHAETGLTDGSRGGIPLADRHEVLRKVSE
jgi:glycosyltransferase involved in cell wall biosynthesis